MNAATQTKPKGVALVARPERVEAALWRRLRIEGAAECRERLFAQYQGLARALARRFGRSAGLAPSTFGDLEQAAYQGLLQAIDRFDPTRNVPFSAFARMRITGAVRDNAALLSEQGALSDFRRRRNRDRMQSISGDSDDGAKAASGQSALDRLADVAVELALALMLDQQERGSGDDDLHGSSDNAFDSLAWRQMLGKLADHIGELPEAEQRVIRQHYEQEMLFGEIATMLGVSKGRVSQLHKSALQRLRKKMRTVR